MIKKGNHSRRRFKHSASAVEADRLQTAASDLRQTHDLFENCFLCVLGVSVVKDPSVNFKYRTP
jgi:hypothetical protein